MSDKNTNFPSLPSKDQIKEGILGKKEDEGHDSPSKEYRILPTDTEARPDPFKVAPGPVIPQDMSVFENKLSKEEIKARTEELNKRRTRGFMCCITLSECVSFNCLSYLV